MGGAATSWYLRADCDLHIGDLRPDCSYPTWSGLVWHAATHSSTVAEDRRVTVAFLDAVDDWLSIDSARRWELLRLLPPMLGRPCSPPVLAFATLLRQVVTVHSDFLTGPGSECIGDLRPDSARPAPTVPITLRCGDVRPCETAATMQLSLLQQHPGELPDDLLIIHLPCDLLLVSPACPFQAPSVAA